jgi:mono/diheme cytochrome c family protein
MRDFVHKRIVLQISMLLLAAVVVLAACAPDPRAQLISPDMVPVGAGEEFVRPTPTPVPSIADLSEEEILAGLPDDVLAAFPGDPAAGEQLSLLNGCVGCHALDPANVAVAPSWHNMANVAVARKPDMSPAAYLYESIVEPNAYVVQGYPSGVMPQNYEQTLTTEQIVDIIAYMLTLRGNSQ